MPTLTKQKKFVPDVIAWMGVNLCGQRLKAKLTREQLAKKAGISVRTLYNIENCVPGTNTTVATLAALAQAVGSTPTALLKPGKEFLEV